MALKDLQSDLSKLRDVLDDRGFEDKFPSRVEEGVYAPEPTPIQGVYQDTKNQSTILSPIDAQIKKGVDFFDDIQGGAKGFVPKTNLESFYNKVQEGNVVPPRTHDGTYYANLNPIEGRKSGFELNPVTYGFSRRGPNPPSEAHNDGIFYPPFGASGLNQLFEQTTLYNIGGFSILNQPAGNSPPGVRVSQPAGTFQPLPPYNFLNSPIANYVSSFFPDNPFSVTLGTEAEPIRGDTVYNNRTFTIVNQPVNSWQSPLIPNAHVVAQENTDPNKIFDVTTMDDEVYGGYNLPEQKSSAGNTQITIDHSKRRGVYDQMINTLFEHQPFPLRQNPQSVFAPSADDRYFSENNGKSIHISIGQIKAGLRYGAIHRQTTIDIDTEEIEYLPRKFIKFNPGNTLVDISATPWSDDFPQFQSDFMTTPIEEFISNYGKVGDKQYGPSLTWGLGAQNYIVAGKIDSVADVWPETANTKPNSPTPYTMDRFLLEGIKDKESILDELTERVEGFSKIIDLKTEFGRSGNNTFLNVPAGLNNENKFSFSDYRDVANRGPFEGKDNHPLILREVGNKWGTDDIVADSPFDSALGDIVRGAPTFTGYIDRVLQDRVRIAKFMFLTSEGLAFTAKQFALQALNPTIESKVYNPLSTLSIVGANDLLDAIQGGEISGGGISALGRSIASLFFQIGHPERHLGNGRYEGTLELGGSRLQYQSKAFGIEIPDISVPSSNTGIGFVDNFINRNVNNLVASVDAGLITPLFGLSNPNKYAFPISSAPKSITNGVPSFLGSADLALADVQKAQNKPGGTFNKSTNDSTIEGGNNSQLVTRHSTLAYQKLKPEFGYHPGDRVPFSAGEYNNQDSVPDETMNQRGKGFHINEDIGIVIPNSPEDGGNNGILGDSIGTIKGNSTTSNVDRINMIPLVPSGEFDSLPDIIRNNPDFVKFNFKNVVENKYLVFRAILDGISDSVSPEYNPTRYIGRPDNLYTYVGTNRTIGFNFKVYPKTKQELPILMEKLNYLVGLCYPSYTEQERMITPFIELTIGDMFVRTPGLLNSLTVTVEDASTWEIEEGLQYPHFISCACEFQHIGQYVPHNVGKHYDLSWLSSNRVDRRQPLGTFKKKEDIIPSRNEKPFGYINKIGGYTNPPLTVPDGSNTLDALPAADTPANQTTADNNPSEF